MRVTNSEDVVSESKAYIGEGKTLEKIESYRRSSFTSDKFIESLACSLFSEAAFLSASYLSTVAGM